MSQEANDEFHSSGLDKYWDLIEPGQIVYMKGDTRPLIINGTDDNNGSGKSFYIIGQRVPETWIHLNRIDIDKLVNSLSRLKDNDDRGDIKSGIIDNKLYKTLTQNKSRKSRKSRKTRKNRKNRKSRRQ
jgi:hypothetical protein